MIDCNYNLVEIAVERDHFEVVMALTEPPTHTCESVKQPPPVARSVSTFVPSSLADTVRDFAASRFDVEDSGLAVLNLPREGRQTFFLPREVMELPLAPRRVAIGMLLEDACALPAQP